MVDLFVSFVLTLEKPEKDEVDPLYTMTFSAVSGAQVRYENMEHFMFCVFTLPGDMLIVPKPVYKS